VFNDSSVPSLTVQFITGLLQKRWDDSSICPLPSDDPSDQAIFFAGMTDGIIAQSGKMLSEPEREVLRGTVARLIGIADEG